MSTPSDRIAETPQPPYYAVIFTSLLCSEVEGYDDMESSMIELAAEQPGFLGVEKSRGRSLFGITVSYWKDEASIQAWKNNADHQWAQKLGKEKWYKSYTLRIAKVERAHGGGKDCT